MITLSSFHVNESSVFIDLSVYLDVGSVRMSLRWLPEREKNVDELMFIYWSWSGQPVWGLTYFSFLKLKLRNLTSPQSC